MKFTSLLSKYEYAPVVGFITAIENEDRKSVGQDRYLLLIAAVPITFLRKEGN